MVTENAMILSPRLAPPSPLPTHHPQTQRALVRGANSQLTHTAAGSNGVLRAGGGTGVGERRPASAGGMGEAGSALEMGRL